MVKESLPSPLVTVRLETDEMVCDCDEPSIVTEISVPETAAEIVCDEPLAAVTFHAAGGARPLAVHVVGSGVVEPALAGCGVAPSDGVDGVVPDVVPPVVPEEAQPPVVAPVVPCAFGSVPVAAVPLPPVEVVPVTAAEVVSAGGGVTMDESTAPASPVVATSVVESVPVVVVRFETVPVSVVPTTAVCCCSGGGAGFVTSCEPPDVIGGVLLGVLEASLLGVELVVSVVVVLPGSDDTEKNCRPLPVAVPAGGVDVSVAAGVLALGGGVEASADAGSVESAPTSSSTTGALANRSTGVVEAPGVDAICECVSVTTGTRRRAFDPFVSFNVWFDVTGVCDGAWCRSAGSGASGRSVGMRRMGAANDGSAKAGSGVLVDPAEALDTCRNATAIGATYIATRTSTPMPVHQYFRPRYRTATSPYGLAVATDA
jgi:hypothetical protein